MMPTMFKDGEIEYYFERRRYGNGAGMKMFTWLNYRVAPSTEWRTYGDPWPKASLSKVELATALADIRATFSGAKVL